MPRPSGVETQREIASKAGKHRKKVEIAAIRRARHAARGTSMGGSTDPKTRAAAGLNPVAGMDTSLEDAANRSAPAPPSPPRSRRCRR